MIFKIKKHNPELYNTLLYLSRNLFFYNKIGLKDSFETRIYLMFLHFSIMLINCKNRNLNFSQHSYDSLFYSVENNLRELGQGDVAVNKKMKDLNKIFYDILLKLNVNKDDFKVNKSLLLKYFSDLDNFNDNKYKLFDQYFSDFYHFCFEIAPENMIQQAIKFKVN